MAAPNQKDKARPVNPLVKAITGVLPEGSLPMRVSAVPLAAPNGNGGIVAITLGISKAAVSLSGLALTMTPATSCITAERTLRFSRR